ncbi:hypothetical protein BJ508DRAFT_313474 [Ascobolus immersus RN42]|uniref:Uncharacterized protein n=1 Tax=Ascobolus immersus RN42 TaxID=1160509 RepID=A0A3N4HIK1_ASCIM|nr:hypothetical protein BJ508DRAFT_313474 [Ascobolus immersus RN42]
MDPSRNTNQQNQSINEDDVPDQHLRQPAHAAPGRRLDGSDLRDPPGHDASFRGFGPRRQRTQPEATSMHPALPPGHQFARSLTDPQAVAFSFNANPNFSDMAPSSVDYSIFPLTDPSSAGYPICPSADPSSLGYPIFPPADPSSVGNPNFQTMVASSVLYPNLPPADPSSVGNPNFQTMNASSVLYPNFPPTDPSSVGYPSFQTIDASSVGYPNFLPTEPVLLGYEYAFEPAPGTLDLDPAGYYGDWLGTQVELPGATEERREQPARPPPIRRREDRGTEKNDRSRSPEDGQLERHDTESRHDYGQALPSATAATKLRDIKTVHEREYEDFIKDVDSQGIRRLFEEIPIHTTFKTSPTGLGLSVKCTLCPFYTDHTDFSDGYRAHVDARRKCPGNYNFCQTWYCNEASRVSHEKNADKSHLTTTFYGCYNHSGCSERLESVAEAVEHRKLKAQRAPDGWVCDDVEETYYAYGDANGSYQEYKLELHDYSECKEGEPPKKLQGCGCHGASRYQGRKNDPIDNKRRHQNELSCKRCGRHFGRMEWLQHHGRPVNKKICDAAKQKRDALNQVTS